MTLQKQPSLYVSVIVMMVLCRGCSHQVLADLSSAGNQYADRPHSIEQQGQRFPGITLNHNQVLPEQTVSQGHSSISR
jgi:hypothetical protein